jgi:hypothetical protein
MRVLRWQHSGRGAAGALLEAAHCRQADVDLLGRRRKGDVPHSLGVLDLLLRRRLLVGSRLVQRQPACANQLRLFLHAGGYWMMWHLHVLVPRRSLWARHAVRYPAPATGQARRSRGGPEASDQAAPADQHARSGNLLTGAGTFAAPDRLNGGAAAPPVARSVNLQPRPKPVPTATAKWPRDAAIVATKPANKPRWPNPRSPGSRRKSVYTCQGLRPRRLNGRLR